MADLTRTIEILFEGTDKTGTAITAVGSSLDKMSANVTAIAAPFAEVTKLVVALDAALTGMAAAGLVYAYKESSNLQSAFTELRKVAGDNVEILEVAKDNAKSLSNEYGDSAAAILDATASYVQAGYSVDEAMNLAKTGMDLVIAGGVDAAQSSEILIASLKGFNEPASEAGRLLDILNEVSNNYATDVEQLGIGMAALSPIASTMGFSMEETAGMLTPVIEVFRSGDEAAVALKTGLLKLIDDSEPVQNALESIGVSQKDANGELRSGKDILDDVSVAFQTLDEDQKLFVTQQLVGINQSARMVTVFDNLAKVTDVTATAMNSAGSAAKEVAARLEDPEVAINRLVAGFQNLASSVGDDFQEAGTRVINSVTSMLNSLESSADAGAFDPLLEAFNGFLDEIEQAFLDVAEALPEALENVDYDGVLDALGTLREAFGGAFDDIDLSNPEQLAGVIQKVIDALEKVITVTTGIGEIFVELGGYISSVIDWFLNLDESTQQLLGNLAGIGTAVTAIAVPVGTVASAIGALGTLVGGIVSAPIVAVGTAITAVAVGTDLAAQKVAEWTSKNEGLEESLAFAKETDEDIARIYEEADKVGPAFTEAGDESKDAFLQMITEAENAGDWVGYVTEEAKKLGVYMEEPKTLNVDTEDAKQKFEEVQVWRESLGAWETITVPVDTTEVTKAKETIEEAIPAEKRLEIETELEVANVKAQADTIQAALQFKAQVDVAEIQAAAEVAKTIAENVSEMFSSAGDTMSGLFSLLVSDDTSLSEKNELYRAISEQQDYQKALLAQQQELTDAQVKYLNAKTKKLESGEALITVDGSGLEPHLEYIMWKLFEAIQIRATQEGLDQLNLGV